MEQLERRGNCRGDAWAVRDATASGHLPDLEADALRCFDTSSYQRFRATFSSGSGSTADHAARWRGILATKAECVRISGLRPHLFDRTSRCQRKTAVALDTRDRASPNCSAAVDRSDRAARFRLPRPAGYGRRALGFAASNCPRSSAGNQAAPNRLSTSQFTPSIWRIICHRVPSRSWAAASQIFPRTRGYVTSLLPDHRYS